MLQKSENYTYLNKGLSSERLYILTNLIYNFFFRYLLNNTRSPSYIYLSI